MSFAVISFPLAGPLRKSAKHKLRSAYISPDIIYRLFPQDEQSKPLLGLLLQMRNMGDQNAEARKVLQRTTKALEKVVSFLRASRVILTTKLFCPRRFAPEFKSKFGFQDKFSYLISRLVLSDWQRILETK